MKIFVLGDSISMHYGPFLKQYLQGLFDYSRKEGEDAFLDLDQPIGANGGDSSMVLKYLQFKYKNHGIQSDFIVINCGLHDIKTNPRTGTRQIEPQAYKSNLNAIFALIASMQLKPIWVRTTPSNETIHNTPKIGFHRFSADVDHYNHIADQIVTKLQIPSIDLHRFTLNLGPNLYSDHIHFNHAVQEKQAAFIAGYLTQFIR